MLIEKVSSMRYSETSILDSMDMGERIAHARREAGLNQTELGKRVGVTKGAVSQWENGNINNLRMANLFAIEDATGFRARWIALGQGPARVTERALSPVEFDSALEELTSADLAALFRLAADQLARQS